MTTMMTRSLRRHPLRWKLYQINTVSVIRFHHELNCIMIYKRRIQVRYLAQLPLRLVGDVELNPDPSNVCAMRVNVRTNACVNVLQHCKHSLKN